MALLNQMEKSDALLEQGLEDLLAFIKKLTLYVLKKYRTKINSMQYIEPAKEKRILL
jgi:hypothetical protein